MELVELHLASIKKKISKNSFFLSGYDSGGGSGGSVWIECGSLAGVGLITSLGGSGRTNAGGGSAGRIAIYYNDTSQWTGQVQAFGGSGRGFNKGNQTCLNTFEI